MPLSVMLNPYRPLPLAGLVFSQPSAGAERSVQHHWGMDKRWDVLPESVGMLPAALRPVKPGIPWRRGLASAAALTMVSWAVWMSIAYAPTGMLLRTVQRFDESTFFGVILALLP